MFTKRMYTETEFPFNRNANIERRISKGFCYSYQSMSHR